MDQEFDEVPEMLEEQIPEQDDVQDDVQFEPEVPHEDEQEAYAGAPEQEGDAPQQRNRREERIQKLANERAEAMAKAQLAQEQAEFYRRQLEQRQQPQREEEFIDPEEKWRRDVEAKTNQALAMANDLNDKASYNLQASKNPLYSRYVDRVEAELQKVRAGGGNASREAILAYVVGQDTLANQGKPTKTAQRVQQQNTAARGSTPGMRSNVQQPSRSASKSLEDRLDGVLL